MTLYLPAERREWYRGDDGVMTRAKREDDKLSETIDLAGLLGSDTIASVSFIDVSGPVITSLANTTTQVTFFVTDAGEATLRVVTAAGQILEIPLRWTPTDGDLDDYT